MVLVIWLKKNITEGRKNKILNKEFKWNKPLILIQGLKDNVVTPDVPNKIVKTVKGDQIQIKLLKNSDHRLSKSFDLKVINNHWVNNQKKLSRFFLC